MRRKTGRHRIVVLLLPGKDGNLTGTVPRPLQCMLPRSGYICQLFALGKGVRLLGSRPELEGQNWEGHGLIETGFARTVPLSGWVSRMGVTSVCVVWPKEWRALARLCITFFGHFVTWGSGVLLLGLRGGPPYRCLRLLHLRCC